MEFTFNINHIFKNSVSKIDNTLVPSDFPRKFNSDVAAQVGEVIDEMGVASGKAQELHHPITSAKKLRDSEHILYLITEPNDNNGKGSVVGLLKVGMKNLFLSDDTGKTHEIKSLCVLDFYVHESKQRSGYGKKLYDCMLNDNQIEPCKYAFDKPTTSLLGFLYKHYGLDRLHPQNNNFVLFEGFFDEKKTEEDETREHPPNTSSRHGLDASVQSDQYLPHSYGRHTAYKLPDSMAGIMWQDSPEKVHKDAQEHQEKENLTPVNNREASPPQMMNGRHTAFKNADSMFELIKKSTQTLVLDEKSGCIYSQSEEHASGASHGRHTAFKLPDTMGEIVEQTRNNSFQIEDS